MEKINNVKNSKQLWYENNKERMDIWHKEYNQKINDNPEALAKIKERRHNYYLKHKEINRIKRVEVHEQKQIEHLKKEEIDEVITVTNTKYKIENTKLRRENRNLKEQLHNLEQKLISLIPIN
jgi:hypothetical protein